MDRTAGALRLAEVLVVWAFGGAAWFVGWVVWFCAEGFGWAGLGGAMDILAGCDRQQKSEAEFPPDVGIAIGG